MNKIEVTFGINDNLALLMKNAKPISDELKKMLINANTRFHKDESKICANEALNQINSRNIIIGPDTLCND